MALWELRRRAHSGLVQLREDCIGRHGGPFAIDQYLDARAENSGCGRAAVITIAARIARTGLLRCFIPMMQRVMTMTMHAPAPFGRYPGTNWPKQQ